MEIKDCNGILLQEGDAIKAIKDLKVKGSSVVIKRGTIVKKIRLTEKPGRVDGKIDGMSVVLETQFFQKV